MSLSGDEKLACEKCCERQKVTAAIIMVAEPSLHFKALAVTVGALVPPAFLYFIIAALKRVRSSKLPSEALEDAADLLPLVGTARCNSTLCSKPLENLPAELPIECAAVGQTVRFSLLDGRTVTTECALDDQPPDSLGALCAMLARLGTEATRHSLDPNDLTIEYGITAECWLTATAATPIFAVLRASHGLHVKQTQATVTLPQPPRPAVETAVVLPPPPCGSEGHDPVQLGSQMESSNLSPALQWLASVGPLATEKRSGSDHA